MGTGGEGTGNGYTEAALGWLGTFFLDLVMLTWVLNFESFTSCDFLYLFPFIMKILKKKLEILALRYVKSS